MSSTECQFISLFSLKQRLLSSEQLTIVDVREADEYRKGHIEGSTLIPLGILPYRLDQLDRNQEIIVVCYSGKRSQDACSILKQHGFNNVHSLTGGLSSWVA